MLGAVVNDDVESSDRADDESERHWDGNASANQHDALPLNASPIVSTLT